MMILWQDEQCEDKVLSVTYPMYDRIWNTEADTVTFIPELLDVATTSKQQIETAVLAAVSDTITPKIYSFHFSENASFSDIIFLYNLFLKHKIRYHFSGPDDTIVLFSTYVMENGLVPCCYERGFMDDINPPIVAHFDKNGEAVEEEKHFFEGVSSRMIIAGLFILNFIIAIIIMVRSIIVSRRSYFQQILLS